MKPRGTLSSHAWGEWNHTSHWWGEPREVPHLYTEAKGRADRPWDSSSYTESVQRAWNVVWAGWRWPVSAFRRSKSSPSESVSASPTPHHTTPQPRPRSGADRSWRRLAQRPHRSWLGGAQPHKLVRPQHPTPSPSLLHATALH